MNHDARSKALVPPAFTDVYEIEFTYVWNTLRRFGVHPADLEDLAHDVFLVVHRRLHTFDPAKPIRPWLFGIAYRVLRDHQRKARHRHEVQDENAEPIDSSPGADDQLHHARSEQQARALIQKALMTLDETKRAVFILHELDGVAVPLVAETLEIPLNTAYSRLRLARQDFSKRIRRLQNRGEA